MPPTTDTASGAPVASVGAILLAVPGQTSAGVDLLRSPLLDRPLAAWALAALRGAPTIAEVVLVVEARHAAQAQALLASFAASEGRVAVAVVAEGGDVGAAIRAGLAALSPSARLIVVHEASRPLVTPALLAAGLAAVATSPGLAAACAASPIKETVKRVRGGFVIETLVRARLALLQTPMLFDRAALDRASRADGEGDGLAGILRRLRAYGGRLVTFPGGAEDFAVATPDDLALAEQLLRARRPS
jgi:2-C-methyl-D-erythritol 4-phosphate cytidylyltransferase